LPTISQDAKLVLTPNAYKVGKLYSAVPNDGTGDFTVNRNSIATYIDEYGLIKTALANVPRIDYSTGEAALLTEPQDTNLAFQSQNFENVIWNKQGNVSITENSIVSPLGDITAAKITVSNIGTPGVRQTTSLSTSNTYTLSCFYKKGNIRYALLRALFVTNGNAFFDLDLGIVASKESDITSSNIIYYGNGWYRCSLTCTTGTTIPNQLFDISLSELGTAESVTIGKYNYIFGAQLEVGSIATSYIPTNSTTVTRLADSISVPTPAGVTSITETIDGVEQTPITTIPATYSLPVGNINKVKML